MRASSSLSSCLSSRPDFVQALQQPELVALLLIGHYRRAASDRGSACRRGGTACPDKRREEIRSSSCWTRREDRDRRCSTTYDGRFLFARAQPVGHPGAHRRPPRQDRARVHLADRADVIQAVGPAGADDGHLIDVLRRRSDTSRTPRVRSGRTVSRCACDAISALSPVPREVCEGLPIESGIGLPSSFVSSGLGSKGRRGWGRLP